jgi:uncharacterized protein (DUF885 family)
MLSRKNFLFLQAALLLAAGLPAHAVKPAPDNHFKVLYSKDWSWRIAQRLEEDEDQVAALKHISPQLPKVDAATQQARLEHWMGVMKQLDTIQPSSLAPEERVNYSIFRSQIQALINRQKFHEYEKPLNADTGFWSLLTVTALKPFHTVEDYTNYIQQLNDFPRYFQEEIVNMRTGLKRGFTPPKVTLLGRDESIAVVANAKKPEDVVFYTPFRNMPASIPPDEQAKLRAQGVTAIRQSVIPAHAELLKFMRAEYIPSARTALAAEALPDGKAYYQSLIVEDTTTHLTPSQIHQIGLDEIAKIHKEMLDTMKQTGFKGDFPAFLHFLRTDPRFYAKTPQELLMQAASIAKDFDGKASQYFGYLPRMRFGIYPVPAAEAPFYTSARGGPGKYLVNTYDLPSRALYSLPALTLHESAPGHAFQMPINMEQKNLPPFRQVYIDAYGEGWALYCERLGTEMGMYHTPYEYFGMLSYQAWRAARLVVDTGIHSQGWTREQAQQYLRDNTALADHEIQTEVDRYISWPAQALSYYLGQMTIWKARHKAEAALGSKFNIRAFHDTVLSTGSVPLDVLEQRIDLFIAQGGKGPYPDME